MLSCAALRAHPRSRGENLVEKPNVVAGLGSSPLTRGKRNTRTQVKLTTGLIPAHAGKTGRWWCRSCSRGAHPRSRGENRTLSTRPVGDAGSSPLTRGKLQVELCLQVRRGLIPAHAGKTDTQAASADRHAAHPRSRGENVHDATFAPVRGGSSPLTRGKPELDRECVARVGLIPAHAGKTSTAETGRG